MFSTRLCKGTIAKYSSDEQDAYLSSSIGMLENELQTLISENGEFVRYANPVMMILKPNATEDILTETVTDEQRMLELAVITNKLHTDTLVVHDIRLWDEVPDVHESQHHTALHVFDTEDVRINSVRMMNFLGELIQKHNSITIVKPGISCPIELSFYIIINANDADDCTPDRCAMNTYGAYIDFLYAVYEYAIYIMNVVVNMHYDLKYNDILDMMCNYGDAYKQFIAGLKRIIERLRKHTVTDNTTRETIV